ncbi:MAG: hypothetical protein ACLFRI_04055 [Candidatus Izemoplasmataceae bacterium]
MFQKAQLSVLDWLLFWVIAAIPVVNVIVIILLLLNPRTNTTFKNYLLSFIVIVIILIVFGVAMIGAIAAALEGLA